jgi:hypothetical protein
MKKPSLAEGFFLAGGMGTQPVTGRQNNGRQAAAVIAEAYQAFPK